MCGIVGVVHFDGTAPEPSVLARMAHAIAHRGPDGEGSYVCGQVGFYHKRLSIIDLVSGDQPMTAEDVTIVFNGEIYNYVELRAQLVKLGHTFRTTSDTEVILRLYHQYGEACVEQLNGMFAFLLHDRSKGILLVARDHFGIKPMYFYSDERKMLFASEIKAILAHGDVHARVNRTSLNDYLTFQFVIGEDTLFENVGKVLPGLLPRGEPEVARRAAGAVLGAAIRHRSVPHRGVLPRGNAPAARGLHSHPDAERRPGGRLPERRSRLEHRHGVRRARVRGRPLQDLHRRVR